MRHALAHFVVHRYKRPLRIHRTLDSGGQYLSVAEELFYATGWKISERFDVLPWDQEGVTGKQRAMIQKSQRPAGVQHDVSLRWIPDDCAEPTHVSE